MQLLYGKQLARYSRLSLDLSLLRARGRSTVNVTSSGRGARRCRWGTAAARSSAMGQPASSAACLDRLDFDHGRDAGQHVDYVLERLPFRADQGSAADSHASRLPGQS
jgi:hypothetical protein